MSLDKILEEALADPERAARIAEFQQELRDEKRPNSPEGLCPAEKDYWYGAEGDDSPDTT